MRRNCVPTLQSLLHVLLLAVALELVAPAPGIAADSLSSPAAAHAIATQEGLAGIALLAALRRGGYVLYLRHASTDFGQNDEAMTSFDNCASQRNLTDRGRAEARAIGAAITALQIPTDPVLASPFCRTLETARLVFGNAQATLEVRGGPARTDDPDRYAPLRRLLSTPVPLGRNLAIVSHGNPFAAVAGPPYLAEGEMAVIAPQGDGHFRIVARVRKDEWGALAP
jgi:phosphohistidine phosphatase SixA